MVTYNAKQMALSLKVPSESLYVKKQNKSLLPLNTVNQHLLENEFATAEVHSNPPKTKEIKIKCISSLSSLA